MPVKDTNSIINQGNNQSVITDYRVRSRFERDFRRYQLGITSPTGFLGRTAAFVQLAAPTLLWVVDWTGCSFLDKPSVPDPYTVGLGWVLLDACLEPAAVTVAVDGSTPLYRLTGTYVFGHELPGPLVYSNVRFPVAPWIDGTNLIVTIAATDLDPAILSFG